MDVGGIAPSGLQLRPPRSTILAPGTQGRDRSGDSWVQAQQVGAPEGSLQPRLHKPAKGCSLPIPHMPSHTKGMRRWDSPLKADVVFSRA